MIETSPDCHLPLSDEEAAVLRAALDRMIPADEFPSACQAGVDAYLARQFYGDLAERLDDYRAGLSRLDRDARQCFGMGFAALAPDRQDAILASAEQDSELSSFVAMLAAHSAEGYYGDPGNGGNRDCVSWKMVGFDPRWTVGVEAGR
jgi:gluconate 2-dehydrogenase gamma chain